MLDFPKKKKKQKKQYLVLFPREYFIRDFMFQVICKHNIGCLDGRGYTKFDHRRDIPTKKKKTRKQGASGGRNNCILTRLREKKRAVGQNESARRLIT